MTVEGAFSQLIVKTNSNPKFDMSLYYGAVLVSKLKSHFIVLILHFMLYFSNLMLQQLHLHAVLRIDSENSFYEGTMVCQ